MRTKTSIESINAIDVFLSVLYIHDILNLYFLAQEQPNSVAMETKSLRQFLFFIQW
jgi:hypothetical protein